MGAYSKRQFARSDFDGTGYQLNEIEGVLQERLPVKNTAKTRMLLLL